MNARLLATLTILALIACQTSSRDGPYREPAREAPSSSDVVPLPQTSGERHYEAKLVHAFTPPLDDSLAVCTWNIQWIGHWKAKRHEDLAKTLEPCDVAVVQEMVAPPWDVLVVDPAKKATVTLKGDLEAKAFAEAMRKVGFDGVLLSEEDTGPTKNHTNSTASEWYVAFFKTSKVVAAKDLPSGFLAKKRAGNSVFSRVPYAFALRALRHGKPSVDFVLVSVHLHAKGPSETEKRAKARRVREFRAINEWITSQRSKHPSGEQDFFVVGDMNIEDFEEVMAFFGKPSPAIETELAAMPLANERENPPLWDTSESLRSVQSMNYSARLRTMTGTNLRRTKPFDHVMHHRDITVETGAVLEILDMPAVFGLDEFPDARAFIQAYSDHAPLRFLIGLGEDKD